jgi:hypothetical protein
MISSLAHRVKNIDKKRAACNFYIFLSTSFSMGTSYYLLNNAVYTHSDDNLIYYRNINI